MTSGRMPDPEADFELLAWADGRLDDDPARLAALHARLARDPEAAARAAAWRAQTRALRQAFGALPATPTPARHLAVLNPRPERYRGVAAAFAASALLSLGAAGGWFAAHATLYGPETRDVLLDAVFAVAGDAVPHGLSTDDPAARVLAPDGVSLTLPAPDLSALGYRLTGATEAGAPAHPVTRLTYAGAAGERLTLFLRPRPHRARRSIALAERGGVTLAHWEDGPYASALAANRPAEETRALARAVRATIADGAAGSAFGPAREAAIAPVGPENGAGEAAAPAVFAPLNPPG